MDDESDDLKQANSMCQGPMRDRTIAGVKRETIKRA